MRRTPADAFGRSRTAESALPARRLLSSEDLGWRTLLARTYRDSPVAEEFATAASPDLLVVLVTSGSYLIESRKGRSWRRAAYHPGSVGVTAPGNVSVLRWRSTAPEPLESLHIHIGGALVEETCRLLGEEGLRTPGPLPDALHLDDQLVVAAGRAISRGLREGVGPLYADSLAQTLAVHLLYRAHGRVSPVTGGPGPASPWSGGPAASGKAVLGPRALGLVTSYMREHLHEDIRLDDLAAQANLSKYHLLRMFASSTGFTPHRYLTRLRLDHASDLLRDTSQTILQVSIACGYRSPGQFAAAFRRRYGVAPSEFRRSHGLVPADGAIPGDAAAIEGENDGA
ncbi:helix-turn-helix transcriptional regulator [Microbispora sp. RL4-1S]|uniref:Helix-turn-helix transcriptional regulator n=1 Tax=Microbispora oryzae TaxID=2806554 RepID=A0A940WHB4_9ACTN|nr:AraC family transcriptional regulator [Microbispora oryzae]MBP2704012.1 helix-turn-helix transcriptional regulator [Microbispora oryzae]